jgi:hypothetical protein
VIDCSTSAGRFLGPTDDSCASVRRAFGLTCSGSLKCMYRRLIDAENQHDLKAVRPFLWTSPPMLFVAKTKTAAPIAIYH